MSKTETYRMGIFLTEDRPTVEELENTLDNDFIERETDELGDSGEEHSFQDKGRNALVRDSGEEYGYCHFRYVSESEESFRYRTDDGDEDEDYEATLKDARVLYFENGQFIIESNQELEDRWVPRFIGRATDYDIGGADYRFYNLGDDFLSDAYQDHEFVSQVKFGEPRGSGVSSELGQFIQDLVGEVTSFDFNGSQGENLKSKSAIDTCADHLSIKFLKARHEDDTMKKFTSKSVQKALDYEDAGDPDIMERVRRESLAAREAIKEELQRAARVYDD